MSDEPQLKTTPIFQKRLNQLNLLKWCFVGIILIDMMALAIFYFTNNAIEKNPSTAYSLTPEELKEVIDFFSKAFWPVIIIGMLHIFLCAFSFIKFHQKKWHVLILVNAFFSLLLLPLGTFLGLVLFLFLFQSKGKDLFQK